MSYEKHMNCPHCHMLIPCRSETTLVRCWRCKTDVPEDTTVCAAGVGTSCKDHQACSDRRQNEPLRITRFVLSILHESLTDGAGSYSAGRLAELLGFKVGELHDVGLQDIANAIFEVREAEQRSAAATPVEEGLEKLTAYELLRQGGEWLGAARNWLKWHTRNGDQVTWGSGDLIEPQLSVRQIEDLAAEVAAAAMRPQPLEQRLETALRARWKAEAEAAEHRALLDARYNAAVAAIDELFTKYEQSLDIGESMAGPEHVVFDKGMVRAATEIREAVIVALRRAAAQPKGGT